MPELENRKDNDDFYNASPEIKTKQMGMLIGKSEECNWCGLPHYSCTCGLKRPITMSTPEELYKWALTYNPYVKKWRAAKREHYTELFNNHKSKNVLSASTIEDLFRQINKNKNKVY